MRVGEIGSHCVYLSDFFRSKSQFLGRYVHHTLNHKYGLGIAESTETTGGNRIGIGQITIHFYIRKFIQGINSITGSTHNRRTINGPAAIIANQMHIFGSTGTVFFETHFDPVFDWYSGVSSGKVFVTAIDHFDRAAGFPGQDSTGEMDVSLEFGAESAAHKRFNEANIFRGYA